MRLTRAQVNKAINEQIISKFPDVNLVSRDVVEGAARPTFYVAIEAVSAETYPYWQKRELLCQIRFFPTNANDYKEEVYEVQDRLEHLFGLNFRVKSRTITIDVAETDIVDGVLHYDFSFTYYDEGIVTEKQPDKMEELHYGG